MDGQAKLAVAPHRVWQAPVSTSKQQISKLANIIASARTETFNCTVYGRALCLMTSYWCKATPIIVSLCANFHQITSSPLIDVPWYHWHHALWDFRIVRLFGENPLFASFCIPSLYSSEPRENLTTCHSGDVHPYKSTADYSAHVRVVWSGIVYRRVAMSWCKRSTW